MTLRQSVRTHMSLQIISLTATLSLVFFVLFFSFFFLSFARLFLVVSACSIVCCIWIQRTSVRYIYVINGLHTKFMCDEV